MISMYLTLGQIAGARRGTNSAKRTKWASLGEASGRNHCLGYRTRSVPKARTPAGGDRPISTNGEQIPVHIDRNNCRRWAVRSRPATLSIN